MADLNKKTYQQLINLLDKEVSIYVRNKAAVNGWCFCYTCGTPYPVSEIDAGHYISRRYYATRYELDNIRPQCSGCNKFRGGEPIKFRSRLVADLGEERVKQLEYMAETDYYFTLYISQTIGGERHLPREWLIAEIERYRKLNKGVKNE
jgi:hypothetical protein